VRETTTETRSSESTGLPLTILGLALLTTGMGLDGPVGVLTLSVAILCFLGAIVAGLAGSGRRKPNPPRV
jgi:hypothetical protein